MSGVIDVPQTGVISLPYPVSANRYWRTFRNRTVRSKEADEYKRTAAHAALFAGMRPLAGPVSVILCLHPKTTKKGAESKRRMDLDNCIKVTIDALNGVAYADDCQVVEIVARVVEPRPLGGLSVGVYPA